MYESIFLNYNIADNYPLATALLKDLGIHMAPMPVERGARPYDHEHPSFVDIRCANALSLANLDDVLLGRVRDAVEATNCGLRDKLTIETVGPVRAMQDGE
ncbi:MAG: hypothetical protein KKG59_05915 [Nanoarchaeota archaeon]|nr:hypothetical protein [Nanoarchaeota archaeon]